MWILFKFLDSGWWFIVVVVVLQSFSNVQLFVTPWIAAREASLSWWCHPTISSSVISFSSCLQSSPASGSFPMSWLFTSGGQSTEASASAWVLPVNKTPVLWPPHAKSWLIGKHSDAGRDWGQEEKGTTEDEMAGWHHWLNGCECEWTPGVGDGQGGLACCDSWGRKELDTTEWLNWTDMCFLSDI